LRSIGQKVTLRNLDPDLLDSDVSARTVVATFLPKGRVTSSIP
jgi:hypothetical protein